MQRNKRRKSRYAAQLSDAVLNRLVDDGVIAAEQRVDTVAILRGISAWLEQTESE